MHFATLFDTNIQGHNVCMLELVYIHLSQCVVYVALEVMLSNNGDVTVHNTVDDATLACHKDTTPTYIQVATHIL